MADATPQLTPDPANANKGTVRGLGMVERSLQQYGAGRSILASKDGIILAGNKTYDRARELGIPIQEIESDGKTLFVIKRTDLAYDDPRAKELAIADNRASETGLEWDAEVLASFADDGVDLSQFWFEDELADLLAAEDEITEGLTDPDDVPDVPDEPITKPGDLWLLGRHRLMCGDSTVVTDVDRLMGGQKADMVFTDPPYNVAYEGGSRKRDMIENDVVEDFYQFLYEAYTNMLLSTKGGAAFYVCHADTERVNFTRAFKDAGGYLSSVIIWVKNNSTFGRQDYFWRHEPILYGWNAGGGHNWYGDHKQDTIWEIDRPSRSDDHPTMKPIELLERALNNSTKRGDIVLDLFGGSGSTLIACEQTNRTAYLMELDPHYCDVIVRRWEQFTGQTATRAPEYSGVNT